jgi:hypothetical protein
VLQKLWPLWEQLYPAHALPSIPPQQRLIARLLTAFYSVRSQRLVTGQLGYTSLWLWFAAREFSEGGFGHSVFAKNDPRLFSTDAANVRAIPRSACAATPGATARTAAGRCAASGKQVRLGFGAPRRGCGWRAPARSNRRPLGTDATKRQEQNEAVPQSPHFLTVC